MGLNSHSRIAAGTINPCRFVQTGNMAAIPAGADGNQLLALQCTGAGMEIIGIGAEWTNAMMGTAIQTGLVPQGFPTAAAGDTIRVYEDGEDAMIFVGSGQTVQPDNLLVSDASGNAVPLNPASARTNAQYVGARALEAGVAGNFIRCQVFTRIY